MQTRKIALGPLTFTVDIVGADDATPVLLLHGFPETRHMWRHQLDALGQAGFRAIAPDQRGYSSGARPAETQAYATDLIVADALALMKDHGISGVPVVEHNGKLAGILTNRDVRFATDPEQKVSEALEVLAGPGRPRLCTFGYSDDQAFAVGQVVDGVRQALLQFASQTEEKGVFVGPARNVGELLFP